jgi:lysylphosphatidylglycerol synthetase-like protein (DUF2156 family)
MMFEIPAYVQAWLYYLLAAIGCLIIFWRLTYRIKWRRTRRLLRLSVAVILLTPVNIVTTGSWLAPAFLVAAYDFVLGENELAAKAALLLTIAFILMVGVVLLESVLRRLLGMERAR